MFKDYNSMSKEELATELKRLKSDLEDFEETSQFYLMNSSAHISGKTVAKYEKEFIMLKDAIAKVEKLLEDYKIAKKVRRQ